MREPAQRTDQSSGRHQMVLPALLQPNAELFLLPPQDYQVYHRHTSHHSLSFRQAQHPACGPWHRGRRRDSGECSTMGPPASNFEFAFVPSSLSFAPTCFVLSIVRATLNNGPCAIASTQLHFFLLPVSYAFLRCECVKSLFLVSPEQNRTFSQRPENSSAVPPCLPGFPLAPAVQP